MRNAPARISLCWMLASSAGTVGFVSLACKGHSRTDPRYAENAPSEREAPMRVLLQRPAPDNFGGGVVHVEKTHQYLRSLGVDAECTFEVEPDLRGYDLVHLFSTPKVQALYAQCANARRRERPVVFSSIYWNEPARDECVTSQQRRGPEEALNRAMDLQLYGAIVAESDLVLTASAMEQQWLARDFGISPEKQRVVPLAAEPFFADGDAAWFVQRYGVRDFVLCAAAVGAAKNQLRLIRAMRDLDAHLILAYTYAEAAYLERCRREASDRVMFLGELSQEQLACAYAAARVHALVSCYEPTGLSTLEAGLARCNLVCTENSPIREYVGDLGWYCDPCDVNSIRRAIEMANLAPRSNAAREHIRASFTWERTAKMTLAAYEELLSARETPVRGKGEARFRRLRAFAAGVESARACALQAMAEARQPAVRGEVEELEREVEELEREVAALRAALAHTEAEFRAVTGTWAYRLYHRLASGWLYRLIGRKRA